MKTRISLLTCLLLCLVSLLATGQAGALTVDITPTFRHQILGDGVQYLEDSNHAQNWEAVQQRTDWQTFHERELNFGFSPSAYWLRFHVTNITTTEQRLILQNRFPFIDKMNFHFLRQGRLVAHYSLGDATPANERTLLHSHFLVPLVLMPSDSLTALIRVQSESGLQLPLVLWEQDAFLESDHVLSIVYGVFYGLLLAMALYHLLIYFSIREVSFLYYALFNFSLLANYACLHGLVSAYLWPDASHPTDRFITVAIASGAMFSNLFTMAILQIPQTRPKLARVLRWLAYVTVAIIVASLTLPYAWIVKGVLGLAGIAIVVLSTALIVRLIDGYPPAKFIFLGGICASTGFSISLLGNIGIIAMSPVIEAAGYTGITIMSMLDAFALSYRMNMDRQLRQDAQTQLIETQRQTNENLDRLVRERTEELETANTLLQQISNTDALTQLHNRRHFDETFAAEFKRAFRDKLPLSVLLMDIDHFKMINDRYGHPFGDLCLISAAGFVRACIRRPPDFAARYGGEEFVVLLPNTDMAGSLHIANLIRDKFNASTVEEGDVKVNITVSIGLASVVPGADDSTTSLLKKADMLLYQAKANGRNRIETDLNRDAI